MQDLIAHGVSQSRLTYEREGLRVSFICQQHRIVAAGHEMIGAEHFASAPQSRMRTVADSVVLESAGGRARLLRQEIGRRENMHINLRIVHILNALVEGGATKHGQQRPAMPRHQLGIAIRKMMGVNIYQHRFLPEFFTRRSSG